MYEQKCCQSINTVHVCDKVQVKVVLRGETLYIPGVIDKNIALYGCSNFEVSSLRCHGKREELVQFCEAVAIGDELVAPIVGLCLLVLK